MGSRPPLVPIQWGCDGMLTNRIKNMSPPSLRGNVKQGGDVQPFPPMKEAGTAICMVMWCGPQLRLVGSRPPQVPIQWRCGDLLANFKIEIFAITSIGKKPGTAI